MAITSQFYFTVISTVHQAISGIFSAPDSFNTWKYLYQQGVGHTCQSKGLISFHAMDEFTLEKMFPLFSLTLCL